MNMTIGERLKRLRTEKGLTQEEVGNILGITKAAVQKYENGTITNFKSDTIRKLCQLYGIAPIYFIFDDVGSDYSSVTSDQLKTMVIKHFGERFVRFLDILHTLNEDGRQKIMGYIDDISQIEAYRRDKYK